MKTSKCFVNCEVGLDGDGYSSISRIKNVTQEPLYRVYSIDNIPTCEIEYDKTINVSIVSVYFIKEGEINDNKRKNRFSNQ